MFLLERFDRPDFLWLCLLVAGVCWFSRRSLSGLGPVRRWLALGARSAVMVLLIFALAGMNKVRKTDDLSVLFVLDQSRSIPYELRRSAETFIEDVSGGMTDKDRVGVLTFDGRTNIEQLPTGKGPKGGIHVPMPFVDGLLPDRTNIAQALRMASACAMESTNNRVIVMSDGNQNVGDVEEEAKNAAANGMRIDVIPLRWRQGAEVVFEKLVAPSYANPDERVPLRLILRSDGTARGQVMLFQSAGGEEVPVDLDPDSPGFGKTETLQPGRNVFAYGLTIKNARAHQFRAEFVPADPADDSLPQNNTAKAFTNVEGSKRVLFIGTQKDAPDNELLIQALEREHIEVDAAAAEEISVEPAEIQDYAAIILANTPAEHFSAEQQQALATYVRDLGGGLVMLGGDESFGAGGWQGSVIEDIMPVKFDVDAVKQIPRGALAIVMHSCEMPDGNKWGVETAVAALKTLSRLDYFGVVGWGGMGGYVWEVKMQVAANKEAIIQQLRKMQNADMMDFNSPMEMAYKALLRCKDASQRHMIVISDGDPSPPSAGLLNRMKGHRITCSTVSIFPHGGFEISTLKDIAKKTGGKYYELSKSGDEKQLPKIFIKEARIVRRPLVRDEVFKPQAGSGFYLSDLMAGLEPDMPELKGYVVTTPRQMPDVEMPLVTKRGDPLLAHWRCGFGRTVAFTSGWWEHWGSNWPEWPSYSKLWAQTVRWCMQQGTAANYDVSTTLEGDEGRVVIESTGEEASSGLTQFKGRLIAPSGEAVDLPIVQTGPGRFEATFKAKEMGNYLINARDMGGDQNKPTVIRTGVSLAYSPEFRDRTINESLLRRIADETDGRLLAFDDPAERVFAHNLPPAITRTPIWELLLKLAIVVFLIDVAVRRIAFDPVKAWAGALGYIGSLTGRRGAGGEAVATLSDLRGVRDRVRTERTAEGKAGQAGAASASGSTMDSGPAAGLKFEASAGAVKPVGDLVESLGGHSAQAVSGPTTPETKPPDQPGESMTQRLLKAKRRAQEQDKDETGSGGG